MAQAREHREAVSEEKYTITLFAPDTHHEYTHCARVYATAENPDDLVFLDSCGRRVAIHGLRWIVEEE
jgi:hypothetical protein